MNLTITLNEIEKIVKAKTGRKVFLSRFNASNAVHVRCPVDVRLPLVGTKTFTVEAVVAIGDIDGFDLTLSYRLLNMGHKIIVSMLTKLLSGYAERTGMISWGADNNQIVLHLEEIARKAGVTQEKIDSLTTLLDIRALTVMEHELEIDFNLKL